jgi:transposase
VLDPGRGRTKLGQLWAYARDDRPWGGSEPPGVAFVYAGDRAAASPALHLAGYCGVLQTDGYGAYKTPTAAETIARIGQLYAVETEIRGRSPDERRAVRQERSASILAELKTWLIDRLELISQKSDLAKAILYVMTHWEGLTHFIDDGRIELDTNTVERASRPLALTRKNSLFAGSEGGAEHWAILASLIATCKLNDVEPQAYIEDVVTKLVGGHLQSRSTSCFPGPTPPRPVAAAA